MSSSQAHLTEAKRIAAASAFSTWLVENRQPTSAALEAWLAADPENRRVWRQRQQTWQLLDEHVAAPELLDLRRRALSDAHRVAQKRWNINPWKSWGLAAGIALLAVVSAALWYRLTPQSYSTAAGERRVLTLPDGSRVELDAQTQLVIGYSSQARELTLLKGQARFDVARDVVRPFSVIAAGRRVVAMGTAFNVDLLGQELRVTLIEGRVAVVAREPEEQTRETALELTPGQQLKIAPAVVPKIINVDVQRATAWQGGKLVFDNEPLAEVVQRVNRYTQRPISVADSRTGALRMSGVFEAGDLDTFLSTVTGYLGVTAQEKNGGFLLTRGL